MNELAELKARAAERRSRGNLPFDDGVEAYDDLDRAIAIAESLKELLGPDHGKVVVETAFATRVLREERDKARAAALELKGFIETGGWHLNFPDGEQLMADTAWLEEYR